MDNTFPKSEKLYRAVYPPDKVAMFWRRDGSISSAAFADPNGLSVDRDIIWHEKQKFIIDFLSLNAKKLQRLINL